MLQLSKEKKFITDFYSDKNLEAPAKRKRRSKENVPTLSKVVPMNPFADWKMPPVPKPYIKSKAQDCL
jgi:hypothetical protein